jgi:hypothetical protein
MWQIYKGQIYLAGLIILLPLVAVFFSGGRSIRMWLKVREQERLLITLERDSGSVQKGKEESYICTEQVPDLLIPVVRRNGSEIVSYSPFTTKVAGNYSLNTHEITLKGTFADLLSVINWVETNSKCLKIISIEFTKLPVSFERKREELRVKILIQTISEYES